MPRFRVLLKIRQRVGGVVKAEEIWVEADGDTGLQATESARQAYLPSADQRSNPPVSVHNCVPLPAEYVPPASRETVRGSDGHDDKAQLLAPAIVGDRSDRSVPAVQAGTGARTDAPPKRKGGRPKGSKSKPITPVVRRSAAEIAAKGDAARLDPKLMPRDDPPTPTPDVPPPPPVRPRLAGEGKGYDKYAGAATPELNQMVAESIKNAV